MPRHRYQLGPSTFRVEQRADGWWVIEEWSKDNGRRGRDEESEESGPMSQARAEYLADMGEFDRGRAAKAIARRAM